MDSVNQYQQIVKQVLREYVEYIGSSSSTTDDVLLLDDTRSVYATFNLGWRNNSRIRIMPVLMRIVGDKIYVEDDNTDYGFVEHLLEAGVSAKNIVLAWQSPDMRQYTEFAVV